MIKLSGLNEEDFWNRFEWKNLVDEVQRKSGKGDAFPMERAKKKATKIWLSMNQPYGVRDYRAVVMLGKQVARAFAPDYAGLDYLDHIGRFILFPHPSGINRWWNEPHNVRKAKRFLRKIFVEF